MRGFWIAGAASVALSLLVARPAPGALITGVSTTGGDAAFGGGPAAGAQRENDFGATIVPFGEDAFALLDRTHQYNGPRFTSAGVLATATAAGDILPGLPSYLVGAEYVSTLNTNRDNAAFILDITVNSPVTAYLLIDNRTGDDNAANAPTLTTVMPWVTLNGWTQVNTGISPGGQPDFLAWDEGATPADFNARATNTTGLSSGTGNGLNSFISVFKHDFPAGTFQTFAQNDGTSRNMYGVVVVPVPEPATIGFVSCALAGLLLRRRSRRTA